MSWLDLAACRPGAPNAPDTWTFYDPKMTDRALRCCAGCPVVAECLDAETHTVSLVADVLGVRGGQTAEERRDRLRSAPLTTVTCERCGDAVETPRPDSRRFCSPACQEAVAYQARARVNPYDGRRSA